MNGNASLNPVGAASADTGVAPHNVTTPPIEETKRGRCDGRWQAVGRTPPVIFICTRMTALFVSSVVYLFSRTLKEGRKFSWTSLGIPVSGC